VREFFSKLGGRPSSFGKTLKSREQRFHGCMGKLHKPDILAKLQASIGATLAPLLKTNFFNTAWKVANL
jgi:hypothetical protein